MGVRKQTFYLSVNFSTKLEELTDSTGQNTKAPTIIVKGFWLQDCVFVTRKERNPAIYNACFQRFDVLAHHNLGFIYKNSSGSPVLPTAVYTKMIRATLLKKIAQCKAGERDYVKKLRNKNRRVY